MTGVASLFTGSRVLGQVFDRYERRARLNPALLMLAPLVVLVIALYYDEVKPISFVITALAACGVLYMASDLARTLGKAKEKALWAKWGGMPSMQVLRHADTTFDPVSKRRYHALLGQLINEPFPSATDEAADPARADAIYTSACNKLRELTRDTKKFHLLFEDNISYGFRRNALGLKPWAIGVCLLSLVWLALWVDVFSWGDRVHSIHDMRGLVDGQALISLLTSIVLLLVWTLYVTDRFVRNAAFSYAKTLVEACEHLHGPAATGSRARKAKGQPGAGQEPVS